MHESKTEQELKGNSGKTSPPPLSNAEKTGELNGINSFTVRRLGATGKIRVFRCGSAVRYDPDEVRAYMAQQGQAQPIRPRPRAKGGSHGK